MQGAEGCAQECVDESRQSKEGGRDDEQSSESILVPSAVSSLTDCRCLQFVEKIDVLNETLTSLEDICTVRDSFDFEDSF